MSLLWYSYSVLHVSAAFEEILWIIQRLPFVKEAYVNNISFYILPLSFIFSHSAHPSSLSALHCSCVWLHAAKAPQDKPLPGAPARMLGTYCLMQGGRGRAATPQVLLLLAVLAEASSWALQDVPRPGAFLVLSPLCGRLQESRLCVSEGNSHTEMSCTSSPGFYFQLL